MCNVLSSIVVTSCGIWILCYLITGATDPGKAFYNQLTPDVPVFAGLVIPLLLAASVASLSTALQKAQTASSHYRIDTIFQCLFGENWRRRQLHQKWCKWSGDPDFRRWGILGVVLPCFVYAVAGIYRHYIHYTSSTSQATKIAGISNSIAVATLIALSLLLVPVARQNVLFETILGYQHPAAVVYVHVWTGRFVMLGVLLHASLYLLQWKVLGESIFSMIFPPLSCFQISPCANNVTNCTCNDLLRNFLGFLAAASLLIIFLSSCERVRRRLYNVFYKIHILAGPTMLFCTILHWKKSIIYLSGGLLYYVACSFPSIVEKIIRLGNRENGVSIASVDVLSEDGLVGHRSCVAMTIAASDSSLLQYEPGQYVFLQAPNISGISHPFSINKCPNKHGFMCIIFRCTGNFTTSVARQLVNSDEIQSVNDSPIKLFVDGFYGNPNRLEQILHHDIAVIVAGGIGATCYLSLLSKIIQTRSTEKLKTVVFHWVCRDESLIAYIENEYFRPLYKLHSDMNSHLGLSIVIHRTRKNSKRGASLYSKSGDRVGHTSWKPHQQQGHPLAVNRKCCVASMSQLAIIWLGLSGVVYISLNFLLGDGILPRLWSPLWIIALSMGISCIVVCFLKSGCHCGFGSSVEWEPIRISEEDCTESSVELGNMNDGETLSKLPNAIEEECSVNIEYREGRPGIHQFLNELDEAQWPGLLVCGPLALINDLRAAVSARCDIRCRQCRGEPRIVIHEDNFEM